MITYNLTSSSESLYKTLYKNIKSDIVSGELKVGEKLPSKRNLAENLGISTVTVENSYNQLIDEGYIYAIPKKGYFVSDISGMNNFRPQEKNEVNIKKPKQPEVKFDFSSNKTENNAFPFSIWAKLMREVISSRESDLMASSPCEGVEELRIAISKHLLSFRGMTVNPDQIVIGAGTEYLYSLLVKLLGNDKNYVIENPGYIKLQKIYKSNGVNCYFANLDDEGIIVDELRRKNANIAHISPTHHFPTGITMPVARRYELLNWAIEGPDRYIIEDDYDSEFRLNGNPIASIQSIDHSGKVIYMNTFSKSLASTIRISYMVLPEELANKFYKELSFYSNTVSTFEQYTLAEFISRGYFEKHINRMRRHYGRKRKEILDTIREFWSEDECKIIENDSGLHFLLEMKLDMTDKEVKEYLLNSGIRISALTDYYMDATDRNSHKFILNYSNMNVCELRQALTQIKSMKR